MAGRHGDWLDRLWIFEGLLSDQALAPVHRRIKAFRRRELLRVLRRQAGRIARRNTDLRPLAGTLRHRLGRG